ncbi:DUF4136 domain-containing protein [Marinobacter sp. X15-166B]|uniref:DUF4136 domain-containing protein n=1 Tax=Marinobacter sp. X15-166B TaxID=1897620 RepID=UPI00085BF4FC|nr:DUF4136 domain-containing protein [Marinobacter sp. X15-166B]OEY65306.1 hypothetical protein BG841_01730 [Marinobacter sp. X15-166B]
MRILMAVLVALSLTGCAGKVVTDYDSTIEFTRYTSWAFAPENANPDFLSLDGARVQAAVEREMRQEGLQQTADTEADLLVTWRVAEEERLDSRGFSYGLGLGHNRFGFGLATVPPVQQVKEGKLVLEFVDTDTKRVVWRAASRRYLNESQSPATREKLIDEVVTEMFKQYPPAR